MAVFDGTPWEITGNGMRERRGWHAAKGRRSDSNPGLLYMWRTLHQLSSCGAPWPESLPVDLDYRLWASVCDCGLWRTVHISRSKVGLVNSLRSLGITIIENISWSSHITTWVKKAQERLSCGLVGLKFFFLWLWGHHNSRWAACGGNFSIINDIATTRSSLYKTTA